MVLTDLKRTFLGVSLCCEVFFMGLFKPPKEEIARDSITNSGSETMLLSELVDTGNDCSTRSLFTSRRSTGSSESDKNRSFISNCER